MPMLTPLDVSLSPRANGLPTFSMTCSARACTVSGAATQIWQDEEFVTPEASQHVARAEEGCHAAGGLTQQFVAGSMAKGVIDRLEAIDP